MRRYRDFPSSVQEPPDVERPHRGTVDDHMADHSNRRRSETRRECLPLSHSAPPTSTMQVSLLASWYLNTKGRIGKRIPSLHAISAFCERLSSQTFAISLMSSMSLTTINGKLARSPLTRSNSPFDDQIVS